MYLVFNKETYKVMMQFFFFKFYTNSCFGIFLNRVLVDISPNPVSKYYSMYKIEIVLKAALKC